MARKQRTKIDPNPFVFARPLAPDELVDRETELALLAERRVDAVNTRLASPRDYGKTSLLHRAVADAREARGGAVLVDLYGVRTAGQMAAQIERAYEALPAGPLRKAHAALRKRGASLGVQTPVGGATLSVGAGEVGERALLDALDLPLALHQRTGYPVLVVFDEFQAVLQIQLDALVRSVIQHHGRGVTYVFSGSHPGMMLSLFADRRRPFYGQAAPMHLGRLPREALASYIEERFEKSGRDAGEALVWLLDLVDGHPQRAMLFAHLLWRHTGSGETAGEDAWTAAYAEAWDYLRGDFEATWDSLSRIEAGVVEALAAGVRGLTGKAAREIYGLPAGSAAPDAAKRLVGEGLLHEVAGEGGALGLVDPVFARWVVAGRRWALE
ncbi:MAG TPA: hypothetical protein VHU14_10300 [Solirubrobacterales bacterium]|jgi:hypothetical protein|nr:hypothetical protein [Solirubrobacterales bacterium]